MRFILIGISISVVLFTGLLSSNNGGTPGGEFPSLFVKGARFYWVTIADMDGDGRRAFGTLFHSVKIDY